MVRADSFHWSGTAFFDSNFSNKDNWFEKEVPQAGDDCVFKRRYSLGLTDGGRVHYDIANGPRYDVLRITGSGPLELTGGRIRARHLEVSSREPGCEILCNDGRADVTLSGGLRIEAGAEPARIDLNHGGRLDIHGLVVDGETRIIAHEDHLNSNPNFLSSPGFPNEIEIHGGISGAGAIFIDSQRNPVATQPLSHVAFTSANTFTGPLTVGEYATLRIANTASLGTTGAGTTVARGNRFSPGSEGTLEIEMSSARTLAEPLTIEGFLKTYVEGGGTGGELTLTGPLTCGSASFVLATPLHINTTLEGTGFPNLTFFASKGALVTLGGTSANTIQGVVTIEVGDLLLDKPAGVTAIEETLCISRSATATWNRNDQLADTATLEFANGSNCIADLNGRTETLSVVDFRFGGCTLRTGTLGSVRVNGRIHGNGESSFNKIEGNLKLGAAPLPISGGNVEIAAATTPAFAGAGLSFNGSGTLRMSGVCSAPATVFRGTLEANSNSPLMAVTLDQTNIGAPATLAGTGTVGTITAGAGGGIVSPGVEAPGILRSGNLSLNAGSVFMAELQGTTPGSQFDQLVVTGSVALNGAELNMRTSLLFGAGSSFTILENDGNDPVIGTFANLPQGALLGSNFQISYTGGTGNDVTLTYVALPDGITRTWTGLGADANWSTAANWSPAGSPQNGDALVFPSGASRLTNINNLTGRAVRAIRISGGPYQISGNAIALAEGITVSGTILLIHNLNLPIALIREQTFSVGTQFLILGGAIDTNGMALTFDTQGPPTSSVISCNGVISEGAADQFVKTGDGRLNLANTNTTRGNFHIRQGVLSITNAAALGSRLGITTVDKSATLFVAGSNLAINETIQLNGTLSIADNAGAPGFGDPIECGDAAKIFVSATGVSQCNLFDELRGSALTKTGPGTLNLTGAKPKSLTTGITIDEGKVTATGTASTLLLPGTTTVGVDPARTAVLEIKQRRVTAADSRIIVNESGSVLCESPEIAIAGITLKGGSFATDPNGIALNGPLATLASAQTAVLSGRILLPDGPSEWTVADGTAALDLQVDALVFEEVLTNASLLKSGPGSTRFTATNSIDRITFQSGSNTWNSLSSSTNVTVTGGTLAGAGRALALTGSDIGLVAPGNGPGVFTTGTLDHELGGSLRFELNGTTPGSGHDQIRCTADPADVNLGGARLQLAQGFTPAAGTVLTLIDIQGAGQAIPFVNLPEGASLLAGSQRYRISYQGGTGNDITLTALPAVPSTPLRVDGFSIAENQPSPGLRTLSGIISGGPGAAGLGIEVEISDDLLNWDPFPIRFADENGNLPFSHTIQSDQTPKLFFRGRVP